MWWLVACVLVTGCGRLRFDDLGAQPTDGGPDGVDAPMGTIAVVQAAPVVAGSGANAQTLFGIPPRPGDMIVVYAWNWNFSGTALLGGAVTDSGANAYQLAATLATNNVECGGGQGAAAIFYTTPAATSSPLVVTVTPNSSNMNDEIGLVAVEYAGITTLDTATPLETAGTTSPFTFATGTLALAAPRLLASVANVCAGSPNDVVFAENQGFTLRGKQLTTNTLQPGYAADKIVTTAGMYADSWTVTFVSGAPAPGIAVIAAFE